MLGELRPDLFPGDRVTIVEIELWGLYLAHINQQAKRA